MFFALGIEIELGGGAGEAVGEDVVPAVAVQVVNEGEEIVGGVGVLLAEGAFETGDARFGAVILF